MVDPRDLNGLDGVHKSQAERHKSRNVAGGSGQGIWDDGRNVRVAVGVGR